MINTQKTRAGQGKEEALLLQIASLNTEEMGAEQVLGLLLYHLESEHNIPRSRLRQMLTEQREQANIPVSIFSKRLSALETIVKYMSENLGMKTSAIARQLNRNVRTIWTTRKNATRKYPERFIALSHERFLIPASALSDRKLSTLESVVLHLKETYDLSFHEIASLLKRDDSTIWTVHKRALKKRLAR